MEYCKIRERWCEREQEEAHHVWVEGNGSKSSRRRIGQSMRWTPSLGVTCLVDRCSLRPSCLHIHIQVRGKSSKPLSCPVREVSCPFREVSCPVREVRYKEETEWKQANLYARDSGLFRTISAEPYRAYMGSIGEETFLQAITYR